MFGFLLLPVISLVTINTVWSIPYFEESIEEQSKLYIFFSRSEKHEEMNSIQLLLLLLLTDTKISVVATIIPGSLEFSLNPLLTSTISTCASSSYGALGFYDPTVMACGTCPQYSISSGTATCSCSVGYHQFGVSCSTCNASQVKKMTIRFNFIIELDSNSNYYGTRFIRFF